MPSGRTHDSITLWSLPAVTALSWGLTRNSSLTLIFSACYLVSGLMFGPDLDIYSHQYKRWGWLRWIWLPYRHSIRHRSVFSHGFLIGSFLRLVYLGVFVAVAFAFGLWGWAIARQLTGQTSDWSVGTQSVVQTFIGSIATSLQQQGDIWLAALIGFESGSMSHSLGDWIGSAWKRYRRKRS